MSSLYVLIYQHWCVHVHVERKFVDDLNLPNCSITSGGKTLEAKALLKMAENSLSRPPIPILLKSQSGLMMEVKACLLKKSQTQQFTKET